MVVSWWPQIITNWDNFPIQFSQSRGCISSLQCFGKRLSHLGFKIELVGSLTEKPATKKDLLIVASGSGESIVPLQITKKAKNSNSNKDWRANTNSNLSRPQNSSNRWLNQ